MADFDNRLPRVMEDMNLSFFNVQNADDRSIRFINDLYKLEKLPIFEQNYYHIYSYLKFKSNLYALNLRGGDTILVERDKDIFLFTPKVMDFNEFFISIKSLLNKLDYNDIKILNVSEGWIHSFQKDIYDFGNKVEIMNRSKKEVVYDLKILNALEGKDFAKLRNIRNNLLINGRLNFIDVTTSNLQDAINLIRTWNKVQGYKYKKNKEEKEIYVVKQLSDISISDKNLKVKMVYLDKIPLSLIAYFQIPTDLSWGEIYMVKGINRSDEGGLHGVSDASYIYIFQELFRKGVLYVNDGELGTEIGTRTHKLRFKPCIFLKSFDLNIKI